MLDMQLNSRSLEKTVLCVTACPAVYRHYSTTLDTVNTIRLCVIPQVMSKALRHFGEEGMHAHHPIRASNHIEPTALQAEN